MGKTQLHEYPRQFVLKILQVASQVLFLVVSARLLAPSDIGLMAFVSVFFVVASTVLELGLGSAIVQQKEIGYAELDGAFWRMLGLSLLVLFAAVVGSPLLSLFFNLPLIWPLLPATCSVLVFVSPLTVCKSLLSRESRFAAIARKETTATLLGVTAGLAALFSGYGVWSLLVNVVLTQTLKAVLFWTSVQWRPSVSPTLFWKRARTRNLRPVARNVLTFNILNLLGKHADDFIVAKWLGAFQLGIYNIAYRVIFFQQELVSGVMNQMVASLYARVQEDRQKVAVEFCRDTQALVAISIPILTVIFVASPWGMPLLLGPQWTSGVVVLQILTVEAMRQSLLSLAGSAMIAVGEASRFRRYAVVSAPVLLVSFVAGLPWGVVGVAASLLLFNSCLNGYLFILFKRSFQLPARVILWQWFPGLGVGLVIAASYYIIDALVPGFVSPTIAGVFAVMLAGFLGVVVLSRLLPVTTTILKAMLPLRSGEGSAAEHLNGGRERVVVLTDPLWSGSNPHLSTLHKGIADAFPDLDMRELNFRAFALKYPLERFRGLSGRRVILHFHFIIKVYESRFAFLSLLRSLRFFLALVLCRLLGARIVWSYHDDRAHDFPHRRVEAMFMNALACLSDRILTFSQRGREIIWDRYGRNDGIDFTPHPDYHPVYEDSISRDEARRELGIAPGETMYLFLGKILPYKGIEDLLKVFREWKEKDGTRLVIAGQVSSGLLRRMGEWVKESDPKICFVNEFVPENKLQLYLRAADFGVLPYREVLHSGTAMLFATFDCPVIVPAIGWFPEIFGEFNIGVMYDPSDPDGLLNALKNARRSDRNSFLAGIHKFRQARSLGKAVLLTGQLYQELA